MVQLTNDRPVHIYTISCPNTGDVVYVGKTIDVRHRFSSHLKSSKNTNSAVWIRNVIKTGRKPVMDVIDTVNESNYSFWEQYYISLFKTWGFKLLNVKIGG